MVEGKDQNVLFQSFPYLEKENPIGESMDTTTFFTEHRDDMAESRIESQQEKRQAKTEGALALHNPSLSHRRFFTAFGQRAFNDSRPPPGPLLWRLILTFSALFMVGYMVHMLNFLPRALLSGDQTAIIITAFVLLISSLLLALLLRALR